MIDAVEIEHFRGIRKLALSGLGRVNLFIGRNDCGKTAILEAIHGSDSAAVDFLASVQRIRHPRSTDLEGLFRDLFHELDDERGFRISVRRGGERCSLRMRLAAGAFVAGEGKASRRLVLEWRAGGTTEDQVWRVVGDTLQLETGQMVATPRVFVWAHPRFSEQDLQGVSIAKRTGRDGEVVEMLRLIEPRLSGMEILVPDGRNAEVFVRFEHLRSPIPLASTGEGLQRALEIALAIGQYPAELICIDEIENGLHHSVVRELVAWLAEVSATRGAQIFASTHSEAVIEAATDVFAARADDGLRVIRLDVTPTETRAVVYDQQALETAAQVQVEIRG